MTKTGNAKRELSVGKKNKFGLFPFTKRGTAPQRLKRNQVKSPRVGIKGVGLEGRSVSNATWQEALGNFIDQGAYGL